MLASISILLHILQANKQACLEEFVISKMFLKKFSTTYFILTDNEKRRLTRLSEETAHDAYLAA